MIRVFKCKNYTKISDYFFRSHIPPAKLAFPPVPNDQLRLQSNQNYRSPSKAAPHRVLSTSRDTTLSNPEQLEKLNVPATYESIVYNPDTKEASTAFSQSNFWETPELIIRDVNQRQEGKNSFVTSSSREEYTPNFNSIQTPLNQIKYRGYNQPSQTKTQPFRAPAPQASPQAFKPNQEEAEEESQNQEVEDDNEEVNEEEAEENQGGRHTYPVNIQDQPSFHPFENVQEPEDIYGDVLSNIGSVFNDDHSSLPPQTSSLTDRSPDPTGVRNLIPEFEQYSYENLQQQERDDVRDDDHEDAEENEELNEYDDDEREESKQVPLQKPKEHPTNPKNYVHHGNSRPANEKSVKESPFPNVKIIQGKNLPPKQQNSAPFSPWLPTQSPTLPAKPKPWPQTSNKPYQQTWQQSAPQIQQQKPRPQQWKKPTSPKPKAPPKKYQKSQKGDTEPYNESYQNSHEGDIEPYNDSYKTSYSKSWKSSSPDTDENSSYHTSWAESKPTKPTHKNYKKEQRYSSSNQEENRLKPHKKPQKFPKNLIQSPSEVKEVIRRSDSVSEESQNATLSPQTTPRTDEATSPNYLPKTLSSDSLVEGSAVDKIDELYNNQHNKV